MKPSDKLRIAGFIAGQIGFPMFGIGSTASEAKADAGQYTDAKLPAHMATAELIARAEADDIREPWIVVDGIYCSKMAGCNWVRESIEAGLPKSEMAQLIREAFNCANPAIYPDGHIGIAPGDCRSEEDIAAFALWAAARAV